MPIQRQRGAGQEGGSGVADHGSSPKSELLGSLAAPNCTGAHYEVLVPAVFPPPAPTDLEACRASGSPPNVCNDLSWTGSAGVTYNVYRSSTSPVPIDAGHRIASGLTETEYTDCGNVYNRYYAVTAVDENGESDPSNEDQASEPCGSAMAMTLPVLNATALTEGGGDPVVTKYFFLGGTRVAMDRDGVLEYLIGDHLGTTSLVLNGDETVHSEARHYPYGGERWSSGTVPTDYRFTGQRSESGLGLVHMGARFYDSYIARWLSADTIVSDFTNPQSLNRFTYAYNRPLNLTDPSGHCPPEDRSCKPHMETESPWEWSPPVRPQSTTDDASATTPPGILLDSGMEWERSGEVELSTYNTYRVADDSVTHPDDLEHSRHARRQGSVELNDELWKLSPKGKWRRLADNPCLAGGGVPLQNFSYCTHAPYADSYNKNVIYVTGAVSPDEDSWFEQGETPIYVTYERNPRRALVVTPIDACPGCEPHGVDVYSGFSEMLRSRWEHGTFVKPHILWYQVPAIAE